jgi:hypothetical protein
VESFSPLSIRMLMLDGTLLIILIFFSNARYDFPNAGQPSILVHVPSTSDGKGAKTL